MFTVAPSVNSVSDILVDAYNRLLQELENTKQALSQDFAKAMYPKAEPEKAAPVSPDQIKGYESDLHRQLADVRAKNTALEIMNRELTARLRGDQTTYTQRCERVISDTYGLESQNMIAERAARFLEEALELAQACGMRPSMATNLVDYVFRRPVGHTYQEIGGVMVTLGGLAACAGLDMNNCGETELKRCYEKAGEISLKGGKKPSTISPFNARPRHT